MVKKKHPVVNLGTSSILVIFIILSLVTFAMLSLASAKADQTYTKKIAQRTADYYTASNQGEEYLAQIDELLRELPTADQAEYYKEAVSVLKNMDNLTVKPGEGQIPPSISFEIPVNKELVLSIELDAAFPRQPEDPFYRIVSWKETSVKEWNKDDSMHLLQSGEE